MVRKKTARPPWEEKQLDASQLRNGIRRIQKCINKLNAFDPDTATERGGGPSAQVIEAAISDALKEAFGYETPNYNNFYAMAVPLDQGYRQTTFSPGMPSRDHDADARKYLTEGKERAIAALEGACEILRDQLDSKKHSDQPGTPNDRGAESRKVFIVHGHNGEAREAVARFLTEIGFEPIILMEQASQGKTIIEKVEKYGDDVGFAVVLLTPDDEFKDLSGSKLKPRARQNVLLELGYFMGRLTRKRVCSLRKGDVEIPTDFAGVVWTDMDEAGAWRSALGKELQAANYEIDWNKIMG